MAKFNDGCHHQVEWEWMSLSQIELVWVRVTVEWECFWVNLREENKVSESNMAEFKMTAIIKLSQNEWVKFFLIQHGRIQDGLPSSSWVRMNKFESDWIGLSQESEWRENVFEWIWEKIRRCLNPRWQCLNPTWQNSRWLPSSSWVRMNEWSFFVPILWVKSFLCNGGNQSWQVWVSLRGKTKIAESKMPNSRWLPSSSWVRMNKFESDWIVWVRVRVEWECFWVNLREENWRCLNPTWQNSRWLPSSSWVRVNEWSFLIQHGEGKLSEVFFVQMVGTNLGKCEWVWEEKLRWLKVWPNSRWQIQDGCHHQVEWEWISLSQIELVWVRVRVEWECFWVNLREENKVSESNIQDGYHHQIELEWISEVF